MRDRFDPAIVSGRELAGTATLVNEHQSIETGGRVEAPPNVIRDLTNYLSGRVFLLILGFASFPLLTRMLTVPEYGVVSLVLRVVLVLTVLSKCGFQYSVNRFFHETVSNGTPAAYRRYYSTLIFSPMAIVAVVVFLYMAVLLLTFQHIQDALLRWCLFLAPGLVILRVLQSLLLGFLRNEGRSRLHSILEVSTKALTLAALICLFISPYHGAISFLAASTASEGCIVLLQLRLLLRKRVLHWRHIDWSLARLSVAFGAPLIAYEFASVVLDSGDRFLVQHFLGATQLGYYSAAYNIGSYFQDTVMIPMNLALLPIYMRLWTSEGPEATKRFVSNTLTWFLAAISLITCLTLLCSKDVIVLLASRRYLEARHLLPIIIPSLMLYATHIFLNAGMIITKRTGLMARLVVVSAAVNIALNLVLIPRFGTIGAAYATLISYALLIASMAWMNQRILPLRPDWRLVFCSWIAACATWFAVRHVNIDIAAMSLGLRVVLGSVCFFATMLALSGRFRDLLRIAHKRLISRSTATIGVEAAS